MMQDMVQLIRTSVTDCTVYFLNFLMLRYISYLFEISILYNSPLIVAPHNVNVTGNNMYSQGEQLILNCQSDGGPQLQYTWIFSGNEISNNQTLTIDNVTAFNGGEYTCRVTNDAGYDSDTVTVYSEFV